MQGLDLIYCCSLFLICTKGMWRAYIYIIVNCNQFQKSLIRFKRDLKNVWQIIQLTRNLWTFFVVVIVTVKNNIIFCSSPIFDLFTQCALEETTITSLFTRRILEQTDGKITFFSTAFWFVQILHSTTSKECLRLLIFNILQYGAWYLMNKSNIF